MKTKYKIIITMTIATLVTSSVLYNKRFKLEEVK